MRNEQTVVKTFQARFGSVVRSQRLGEGLSQEELAHRSGLHRTYVTDVERGARNPSLNSIKKLSDALGVPLSELFALVEGQSKKEGESDSGSDLKSSVRKDHAKVLVAGDVRSGIEPMLQSLNANLLSDVRFVHDGAEALDYIFCTGSFKKRDFLDTPDCLLLDMGITKVNGLDVLGKMRENPVTQSIPVIALVSQSDQNLEKAKQLGITDFITAPVDFPKFARALAQAGLQLSVVSGPK